MAISAAVPREKHVVGDLLLTVTDITFDSSYAISGEAVTAANLGGRNRIIHVFDAVARKVNATTTADNDLRVKYDSVAGVLQAFWGDNDAVADGPGVEVPNATDLSTYTVRLTALVK